MIILQSKTNTYTVIEEEILAIQSDSEARNQFKETVYNMSQLGFAHDYIMKDGERIERFTRERKQKIL